MVDKQKKVERARELFLSGYNCAQAVCAAFAPEMGLDEAAALRLSSGFGGGMGGMRGVCGAISGMVMAYGMLRGYDEADDMEGKKEAYAAIQHMTACFTEKYENLHCRVLLKSAGRRGQERAQRAHARVLQDASLREVRGGVRGLPRGRIERRIRRKQRRLRFTGAAAFIVEKILLF